MGRTMLSYDSTPEALLQHHGAKLRGCLGETLDATWVAWDTEDDRWFQEEAVVLQLAGQILGVNCWKLDEIALCWNGADLASRPAWVADWGAEFSLEWRRDGLTELAPCVGQTIREINVVEYLYRTTVIESRHVPESVGRQQASWVLNGIEFVLSTNTLSVFNALDQNGVAIHADETLELRRTPVRRFA